MPWNQHNNNHLAVYKSTGELYSGFQATAAALQKGRPPHYFPSQSFTRTRSHKSTEFSHWNRPSGGLFERPVTEPAQDSRSNPQPPAQYASHGLSISRWVKLTKTASYTGKQSYNIESLFCSYLSFHWSHGSSPRDPAPYAYVTNSLSFSEVVKSDSFVRIGSFKRFQRTSSKTWFLLRHHVITPSTCPSKLLIINTKIKVCYFEKKIIIKKKIYIYIYILELSSFGLVLVKFLREIQKFIDTFKNKNHKAVKSYLLFVYYFILFYSLVILVNL